MFGNPEPTLYSLVFSPLQMVPYCLNIIPIYSSICWWAVALYLDDLQILTPTTAVLLKVCQGLNLQLREKMLFCLDLFNKIGTLTNESVDVDIECCCFSFPFYTFDPFAVLCGIDILFQLCFFVCAHTTDLSFLKYTSRHSISKLTHTQALRFQFANHCLLCGF